MKFPFFRQFDVTDCGPTCLRMICHYYKKKISIQYLRNETQIGKQGVNLLGIMEAAESIGFTTEALQLDIPALITRVKLPSILHWNQNHFVVLYKIKKDKFFVADPAKGKTSFRTTEFKLHWLGTNTKKQGVALQLIPGKKSFSKEGVIITGSIAGKEQSMLRYIRPYRKLFINLFFGLIVSGFLQLLFPLLTKSLIDTGVNKSDINFIYLILLAQFVLLFSNLIMEFLRSRLLLYISSRINLTILTDFLTKLLRLPIGFFESKQTGDILQRMNDHSRIESFLTGSSLSTLFSIINLIILSIVLVYFDSFIFLVFMAASLLHAGWMLLFLKVRKRLDVLRFNISAREKNATIQMINGMQDIKLNCIEDPVRFGWERIRIDVFGLNIKYLSITQIQRTGSFFLSQGKNIIIIFLCAKSVIDGSITLGTMLAIQAIVGQLASPVGQLQELTQNWQNAKLSMDRLNDIQTLSNEDEEESGYENSDNSQLAGNYLIRENSFPEFLKNLNQDDSLSFDNVKFSYLGAGNKPVIDNFSAQFPIAKTTAIVGASGSGKTSLLKLILRFYEPQQGQIRIGKTQLTNINHKTWRSNCGAVMQESFIFSDSIGQNIYLDPLQANPVRLARAIEIANLNEFIDGLPLGLETKIGAEGAGISVGQKQRILIARAVYRNPEFILFDEATNSLDANNENAIMRNLYSFFKGKTVILVAHRLSTVMNADKIIVLDKGQIIESGKHEDLLQLRGAYYTLVKNQLELGY